MSDDYNFDSLTSVEVCAGAGGQALGLEQAGFQHLALVEIDQDACSSLRVNRPNWNIINGDLREHCLTKFHNVDLLSGGLPCPPFSIAGKQLGDNDERNLFPVFFDMIKQLKPNAVLIENVKGLLSPKFSEFLERIKKEFDSLEYQVQINTLFASEFGVSQLRPRVAIVAFKKELKAEFVWPKPNLINKPKTVGELLFDLISSNGWRGASDWKHLASTIAPTIVGGSKRHGGPDLGPTRAKEAWAKLGVDGRTIALEAPGPDYVGRPRLTVEMVARIQDFPDDWSFFCSKTSKYRQVGNAFPPPVARVLGESIASSLLNSRLKDRAA